MKSLLTRAGKVLSSKRGEMYVDKAVGIIISVVTYAGAAVGGAAVGVASYNLITGRRGW